MTDPEIMHLPESAPRSLDVAALERDVAALWRSQGAGQAGEGMVARACLSTLVIPRDSEDGVDELLDDITRHQPSRVILVHPDGSRPEGEVTGWVAASCRKDATDTTWVCAESIHLRAGPRTEARVASAVRALEVGGVPLVALVESGSPLEHGWIANLGTELDLVLGDSARLSPEEAIRFWKRAAEPGRPGTRDLQWTRSLDWRRAVARGFDGPGEHAALERVTGLRVGVGADGMALTRLLVGWLVTRLGWSLTGDGLSGPLGAVSLDVNATDAPAPCSRIEMLLDGSAPDRLWTTAVDGDAILVQRGAAPAARLHRTRTSRAWAIVREIHRHAPDPVAGKAMEMAVALMERGLL